MAFDSLRDYGLPRIQRLEYLSMTATLLSPLANSTIDNCSRARLATSVIEGRYGLRKLHSTLSYVKQNSYHHLR